MRACRAARDCADRKLHSRRSSRSSAKKGMRQRVANPIRAQAFPSNSHQFEPSFPYSAPFELLASMNEPLHATKRRRIFVIAIRTKSFLIPRQNTIQRINLVCRNTPDSLPFERNVISLDKHRISVDKKTIDEYGIKCFSCLAENHYYRNSLMKNIFVIRST